MTEATLIDELSRPYAWPTGPMTLQTLRAWHVQLAEEALKAGKSWLEHGLARAAEISIDQARFHKRAVELIDLAIEGIDDAAS
jgi:hypothetical protein